MKKVLLAMALVAAAPVMAADPFPCVDQYFSVSWGKEKVRVCYPPDTPRMASVTYTDQHGIPRVARKNNPLILHCADDEVCMYRPEKVFMGTAPAGVYAVPYGWYIDTDKWGRPTAYPNGTGPQIDEPRFDPEPEEG